MTGKRSIPAFLMVVVLAFVLLGAAAPGLALADKDFTFEVVGESPHWVVLLRGYGTSFRGQGRIDYVHVRPWIIWAGGVQTPERYTEMFSVGDITCGPVTISKGPSATATFPKLAVSGVCKLVFPGAPSLHGQQPEDFVNEIMRNGKFTLKWNDQQETIRWSFGHPVPRMDEPLSVSAQAGTVWSPPQAQAGEGLGQHPMEPATVYLTPYKPVRGKPEVGAEKLIMLPLVIRRDHVEHYVQLQQLIPAGDWVVLWSHVIVPGAAQHSGRLDAVNVKTKATRFVTDALLAGGNFFDWRVEPGRVFWEKRRTTPTGIELVESIAMDLNTGEKQSVPPGAWPKKISKGPGRRCRLTREEGRGYGTSLHPALHGSRLYCESI